MSNLRGFPFSGCGWSMATRVYQIMNIAFTLRKTPPVSDSTAEATKFLVFDRKLGWVCLVLDRVCWWLVGDF